MRTVIKGDDMKKGRIGVTRKGSISFTEKGIVMVTPC